MFEKRDCCKDIVYKICEKKSTDIPYFFWNNTFYTKLNIKTLNYEKVILLKTAKYARTINPSNNGTEGAEDQSPGWAVFDCAALGTRPKKLSALQGRQK